MDRVDRTPQGYFGLSEPERRLFAVEFVDLEVYNGGFDQYFFNSSASHYNDAVLGLREMGAVGTLALLEQAKQILFGFRDVPEDWEQRRQVLRESESTSQAQRLDQLDASYCKDPDGLRSRCEEFARRHRLLQ